MGPDRQDLAIGGQRGAPDGRIGRGGAGQGRAGQEGLVEGGGDGTGEGEGQRHGGDLGRRVAPGQALVAD
jgi:hypothetical protein